MVLRGFREDLFARVTMVCFRFLAWNLCFFPATLPGLSEFHRFYCPGLLAVALLGRVLGWFGACLLFDLFFFEVPVLSLFGGWPLCDMFFDFSLSLVVQICYIFLLITHICGHACRILFGLGPVVVRSLRHLLRQAP